MNRTAVISSNLASVGYDSESSTLEVEFVGGSVYQYFGVPAAEWEVLMQASSHGTYFNANIRNNYSYVRL